MPHWRTMIESPYVGAWDLNGKDVTVTISKVEKGMVKNASGETSKPIIHFEKRSKPLCANATNCKTIQQLYGPDTTQWTGKRITLYPTTTRAAAGDTVEAIRIRPVAPPDKAAKQEPTP